MRIDLNGRVFHGTVNYHDGDLNQETRFRYFQSGNAVWGTVEGGGVAGGGLVASVGPDNRLTMRWHYVTPDGRVVSGGCISTPEVLADGRLRLYEEWQVDESGERGESQIEEIIR